MSDTLNRFLARLLGWQLTEEYEEPPDYVNSFADCEPLLKQIEADGWDIGLEYYQEHKEWRCWMVRINDEHDDGHVTHEDKEFTEALCRCVAKAYGWQGDAT